ncbi:2-amino-4-hydroxy-6-hydroxymethyldihydropteridine diphosphokinase [Blastomonas natatoria]|uniref:2-amino-4-hydroxy-6-hydroxymethyldihydropteridine pyrophosphokinase n=1 Tax=Blastomonas natatoria TaxID=34015 RepID=A0A2V3V404_9SPHN|nr:2-amino-4-hydroxy-6-hydroxymethyldihydropteridine diphosphokinase [Blastomonas natatoria]PXW69498.1 2-amino-4-hydroxy-6-hydroxymethyldihydropteridine diphosphokinase [Blastomonas natatoria]
MTEASLQHYLIALGSNRRHHRIGTPRKVLDAALLALASEGVDVLAVGPVIETAPIGPSLRRYANGAAVIATPLLPDALLALLKRIEARFGRRRGQRWSARTLDLDIILWSGGTWHSPCPPLIVPHPAYRTRNFVLRPAAAIAPGWRDPLTGLSIAQLCHRAARG